MNTIVCTGGGTGGHIYPGLAVAAELKAVDPDLRIVWFGSAGGRDKEMVLAKNEWGLSPIDFFAGVPSGKLRRYFSFRNIFDMLKVFAGFFVSLFYLIKIKPRAVFSKGGFVSVPPCAAAKVLGIPVYTHECDFSPGLATRINSRFATLVLLSYDQSRSFFSERSQSSLLVTGNPVRSVFYEADAAKGLAFLGLRKSPPNTRNVAKKELKRCPSSKLLLLVLGGSSGARQINNLVFENLEWLCDRFIVVHQTGRGKDFEKARNFALKYNETFVRDAQTFYRPYDFIHADIAHVTAACDLVFSRAGANTLWECAVCAKPMLLLPLAGSGTRGDQLENAVWFEKCGCALVLDSLKDGKALSDDFKNALAKMQDKKFRLFTAECASKLAGLEKSAQKIADILYTGAIRKNDL